VAVPNFLKSSYYFHSNLSVADNDAVLDDIVTALTGQTPAWTIVDGRGDSPATILATSPVDVDGRFFDVLFTVVAGASNLKMEYRVRDQNGVTVMTRRTGTAATNPWRIFIYSGEYHIAIDFYYISADPEHFRAGISDFTPEVQSQNSHYVYGHASKTSADTLSNNTLEYASMVDNATPGHAARCATGLGASTAVHGSLSEDGYRRYIPIGYWCRATGETTYSTWAGRGYQQLVVPGQTGAALPFGAHLMIPVDIGTVGTFRVTTATTGESKRLAIRIA
jgi:hypothetical protein